MSEENNDTPLGASGLKGPTHDFADYCEQERQRRINSGEPFDRDRLDQAIELVMGKLKALEVEE